MKKLVVVGLVVVTAVMLFSQFGAAQTQKLIPVNTAWMSEHELFFAWYAKEKGFDKQEGLDMKLLNFDSGMAIAEALPAKQWVLGATGGVPMVVTDLAVRRLSRLGLAIMSPGTMRCLPARTTRC